MCWSQAAGGKCCEVLSRCLFSRQSHSQADYAPSCSIGRISLLLLSSPILSTKYLAHTHMSFPYQQWQLYFLVCVSRRTTALICWRLGFSQKNSASGHSRITHGFSGSFTVCHAFILTYFLSAIWWNPASFCPACTARQCVLCLQAHMKSMLEKQLLVVGFLGQEVSGCIFHYLSFCHYHELLSEDWG